MFAVVKTGGKQYKVSVGSELDIELLPVAGKKTIQLDQILLISENGAAKIGCPCIKGAYCEAEVLREAKAPRVISFKYIRREKSATKIGHRQKYLRVKIKSIHGD